MLTGTAPARPWKLDRQTYSRPRTTGALRRPASRAALALGLALFYAALTVAVLAHSQLDRLDTIVLRRALSDHTPWLHHVLSWWVLLGQRGICLGIAATWLAGRALRRREIRPLLTLAVVTVAMNLTVGAVKLAVGRLGPLQLGAAATSPWASHVFADGTIFPSGHTANAVVTWGLLAMLARRNRSMWRIGSAFVAATVGLTTIFLGTHWVSDVLAGWVAGALVLLAVPTLMPTVHRAEHLIGRVLPRPWRAPGVRSGQGLAGGLLPRHVEHITP
jgi:undecaprenyl-diphosphatase